MSRIGVKEAFIEVRDGRSAEYVICDETLNARFLEAARQLGVSGKDAEINKELINLRKANKLKDCPTINRKKPDPNSRHYRNAVLNTVRFVERQFSKNVDDIISDPEIRSQFDAMIQFLCPGTSAFEAQYAALSLRKSSQLKPEPVGQVIRATNSRIFNLVDIETNINELPTVCGVYLFFDEDVTLYAGKAENLRSRIRNHISTWTYRDLIRQIRERRRTDVFVVYHELPVTISARELAAYETEIIRSRNPEHNRTGRTSGND